MLNAPQIAGGGARAIANQGAQHNAGVLQVPHAGQHAAGGRTAWCRRTEVRSGAASSVGVPVHSVRSHLSCFALVDDACAHTRTHTHTHCRGLLRAATRATQRQQPTWHQRKQRAAAAARTCTHARRCVLPDGTILAQAEFLRRSVDLRATSAGRVLMAGSAGGSGPRMYACACVREDSVLGL